MITFLTLFAAVVLLGRSRPAFTPAVRTRWKQRGAAAALVVVAVAAAPTGLILSKTIGRTLLPLGLLWIALLLITALRLILDDKRAAIRTGALAVVVTVLGSDPIGQGLMDLLEAPYQADPLAPGEPFDAVIVLGGGAQEGAGDAVELGPSGDRIFLGARLFHTKRTPLLVTTGTVIEGFQRPFDSLSATTRLWTDVGVDPAAIIPVTNTRTTREEAEQCARLIKERGWQRVGLVTSAWHLRRALGLFKRAGVDVVVPLAADHRGAPTWEGLYSLVPTGNGAYLQQKAMWEWIGAAVGR
ncbi:MAG: YdcF family protein [Deltaproteobacteria bacterium]|nr:YdcF family protein [Deltaproteobacteria bacterium]